MWLKSAFIAPDLPTRQRYLYIEACRYVATFEWLISWAEMVEFNYDDFYSGYPFSNHQGPEPIRIIIHKARKALIESMAEQDLTTVMTVLQYEITKFANTLALARYQEERSFWDLSSFMGLVDLEKYEP